ncbi:hypothetical protein [Candidatus Nanohalovita haloferacivicina]|nr:hypothetical protein HBNXNv_0551 [Candidatus Nanohalobia archaeon BNXNv]
MKEVVSLRKSCDECGYMKPSEEHNCLNCGAKPPREKMSFAMKALY